MKLAFSRLSARIIRSVIVVNFLTIAIVVTIQVYYRYRKELRAIDKKMGYIDKSYLPSIANSLFKLDRDQLDLLMNGILTLQNFEYVEVTETTGQHQLYLKKGKQKSRKGNLKVFPIEYKLYDGHSLKLGTLKVFAGYNSIMQQVRGDMVVLVTSSSLFVIIFSMLLLIIFKMLVSRHLINLANYAANIDIENLTHNLKLNRKKRKHFDELDKVVAAINNLEIRLLHGIELREKANIAHRKSEDQLSLIFNTVSDLIVLFRVDKNTFILETVNSSFIKTYQKFDIQVDIEQLRGKDFMFVSGQIMKFSKENTETFAKYARECVSTGKEMSYESHSDFASDTIFLLNKVTPIFDHNGLCSHLLYVARNITERKLSDKKILNTIIKTEEKEKSRFAREIHDGLGPILSTAKLYVQSLKDEEDEKEKDETLKRVFTTLEESLTSIKEISNNLSPHVLKNFGLVRAIKTFIHKITTHQQIYIELNSNLESRLDEIVETTFYRVIIELVNNTTKHANATHASIYIDHHPGRLGFKYTDNGKGFDVETVLAENKGFGLFNMQNRFSTLNGNIKIISKPGRGMEAEGFLPLSDIV